VYVLSGLLDCACLSAHEPTHISPSTDTVATAAVVVCTIEHDAVCAGSDFTEEGFECIVSFLYTGSVDGVTTGVLDATKLAAALQAADHFKLDALRHSAEQFAVQQNNSSS
jgi:BTB/POZ domain